MLHNIESRHCRLHTYAFAGFGQLRPKMQFDLGNLASLAAVVVIGALLSQLAAWVRYHLKVRKIPVAHDLGLWDRLFTGKARVEFATDFEGLSRRGLAKVR